MQSLITTIDSLEATVTSKLEVVPTESQTNIKNNSASSAVKVETDDSDNRTGFQSTDIDDGLKEREKATESESEKSPRSDEVDDTKNTSRRKVYVDDDGVEDDLEKDNRVSALFGKMIKNLSAVISEEDEGKYQNQNTEENDDNYMKYNDGVEKKKVKVVKPGSAQKKRVKFARTSGRLLRNIGGALAKSATDTLGFWVGLGFDEIEVVEDDDVRVRKAAAVLSQAPKQINSDIVIESSEIILLDDISNTESFSWKGDTREPVRIYEGVRALNPSRTYSENVTAYAATTVGVGESADNVSTQDSTGQTDLTETNWEKALITERRKKEEERIEIEMTKRREKEEEREKIQMMERQREEEEYDLIMEKQMEQQERETEEALGKTLDYDRVQVINDDSSVYNELD